MARYKLVFTVPLPDADKVRKAVGEAGAGKSDKYAFSSFSVRGTGRFLPLAGADPSIGEVGKMEEVEEERVECHIEEEHVDAVIAALKDAHPYEEIAFDLYKVEERE